MFQFHGIVLYLIYFIAGILYFYILNGVSFYISQNLKPQDVFRIFRKSSMRARYIANAIAGGILAVLCTYYYDDWKAAITVLLFLGLLSAVAFVDIDTMEIPDGFVLTAFIMGVLSLFTLSHAGIGSRVAGMFVVSVPLFLLTMAVPGAFGGGDIKLMAGCGLLLGVKLSLLSLAAGILTGGMYGIWLLLFKKKSGKEHFAFGPCLCMGMAAALFWGDAIMNWYLGLLI